LKDLQSAFTLKRPVDYSKQQAAVEEIEEDGDDEEATQLEPWHVQAGHVGTTPKDSLARMTPVKWCGLVSQCYLLKSDWPVATTCFICISYFISI
jgi:hypothetical protein